MSLAPLQQNKPFGLGNRFAGVKLTQANIDRVALLHKRFVKHERDGQRALLSGADLSGLNLATGNFNEADFTSANLSNSCLRRAQLERANLFCTNLEYCDATFANLKGADVRGATLRGADFSFATLDDADFRAAAMFRMGHEAEQKVSAGRPRKNSGGVDFTNCSLKGASLHHVTLKSAIFRNALLDRASFTKARISEVDLDGAVLTNIDPRDLPFPPEALRNCVLDPGPEEIAKVDEVRDILSAHEQWVVSGGKSGKSANLDGYDLRPMRLLFKNRRLTALSAKGAMAIGVDFSETQLQGAQLSGADLRDAGFSMADIRGADLSGTKLAHARFDKADVRPLALLSGSSRSVNLSGADYHEEQFSAALRE